MAGLIDDRMNGELWNNNFIFYLRFSSGQHVIRGSLCCFDLLESTGGNRRALVYASIKGNITAVQFVLEYFLAIQTYSQQLKAFSHIKRSNSECSRRVEFSLKIMNR